ncbi:MAG: HAMP domain-containing sensor histidine kinase [Bacteroidota bacterium]|nr:HAMP domain-containing sensor histidine kinase [Bacteroidota bacterium]
MNSKQHHILNRSKFLKDNADSKTRSSKLDLSAVIANNNNALKNHFMLRLQEMEELNVHLENLVEQRTQKLIDVVATNSKFMSILAHDLRSPFCSILGVLEILNETLDDYDINEIKKYIDTATNSVNNTLNLLDDLLAWTMSQNKEKSFNPVKINLYELLRDEVGSINTSATQKQIALNYFIAPNLNISADIQMVRTILRNLISNAIKYTNTGGEITVTASENNQFIEIAVKDNGIGIPFEAQRKIFKRDEINSTPGTNNEKGTGLGLLLCKEFVEMHGGDIWIESEPGKGSEFKFTLPHYL